MKNVLITGATSGIGMALASQLASGPGYRLILCGRRESRLRQLSQSLGKEVPVRTLAFDVRDRSAMQEAVRSLETPFNTIDVLVNNAGNAHGLDSIDKGSVEDWEQMIDINVKGLLYLTREITPQMVQRRSGQIINVGSIAGKEAYPAGNVYCASKAAVDSLTEGMRLDLFCHNIRVAAVHPGLVETEFSLVRFKGDQSKAGQVYEGLQPLSGEDVAAMIRFMIEQPEHVNVADVLLLPTAQAGATRVDRRQND